jgi:polysaccharide deacetylase family protein (PEP-CTERM system associated)
MINALTIDLEDWYQGLTSTSPRIDQWPEYEDRVVGNTRRILEILGQAEVKATFFVLGYVADQFPNLIRKVADDGHEIALHSYYHQHVHRLTPEQFRKDVVRGLEAVEQASGKKVIGFRAPMFSINGTASWALQELCDMGFHYDSSIFPIRNFYYGNPNAPQYPYQPIEGSFFTEFPLATVRFFGFNWPIGGGFYVRSLPYAIIRAGIRHLNRLGQPAVMYLHPWELDLAQHYDQVTFRERITHYHGRASLEKKLRRLIQDFKFAPVEKLLYSRTL